MPQRSIWKRLPRRGSGGGPGGSLPVPACLLQRRTSKKAMEETSRRGVTPSRSIWGGKGTPDASLKLWLGKDCSASSP